MQVCASSRKWQTWVNSSLHKFIVEIFGAKIIFKYVSIGFQLIKEMGLHAQKNLSSTCVNSSLHKFKIEVFASTSIFKYVSICLRTIGEIA